MDAGKQGLRRADYPARLLRVLRPIGWRGDLLALTGAAMAAVYWFTSAAGPGSQLASILLASLASMVMSLWISQDIRFKDTPVGWLLVLALGIRLIATQASPLLEDDH